MAIDQKELLQRASIKTMKKDLKRLREADAKKESQKIISVRTPEKKAEPVKPAVATEPSSSLQVSLQAQAQSDRRITDLKHVANESEKQEIFLLESRRKALAQKLIDFAKGEEVSLMAEKDKAIAESSSVKEHMDQLTQKAQDKGDKMAEQQAWFLAQELKKADSAIQGINEQIESVKRKKGAFQLEIQGIDDALRSIADGLEARKSAPPAEPLEMKKMPIPATLRQAQDKPPAESAPKTLPHNKPEPLLYKVPEKPYLKEVPARVKEKLSQSAVIEEEARRKFMEDVDQWAAVYEKSHASRQSAQAKKRS